MILQVQLSTAYQSPRYGKLGLKKKKDHSVQKRSSVLDFYKKETRHLRSKRVMKLHQNSSPYLGYIRHAPSLSMDYVSSKERFPLHSQSSPYVGFLRHAPPSGSEKNTRKSKEIDILVNFMQKNRCCGGRLMGGSEKDISYSICHWFETTPSAGLFQYSYPSKQVQVSETYNPLDSLDMLNKLAHWFLFPIANDIDAGRSFEGVEEGDPLYRFASFLSSLMKRLFQNRFSLSIGTNFNDTLQIESSHGATSDTHIQQSQGGSVMFQSISSIDSEELRCQSPTGNHLDIESILRLPTMTFEEESSSEGVFSSANTYDTDGGHTIKSEEGVKPNQDRAGLEWSWITVPKYPSESVGSLTSIAQDHPAESYKDDKCVICLENFHNGDKLRILPCQHRFHTSCIDKWLSGSFSYDDCVNAICPTCKTEPTIAPDSTLSKHVASVTSFGSEISLVEFCDDDSMQSMDLDGAVPSWSFRMLGSKIAR